VPGIIDREQHLVVEYAYDPWGKVLEARSLKMNVKSWQS